VAVLIADALPALVVDGGDRGCGDLLLTLVRRVRGLPPGSVVRLITADPADPGAPADLPAWCRLTGHELLCAAEHDGRPAYDLRLHPTDRDQQKESAA